MKYLLHCLLLTTTLLAAKLAPAQCMRYDTATPECYDTVAQSMSRAHVIVASVKQAPEIVLYPNPAINELNVLYDAKADVKNIAVYNLIGRLMTVYKTAENGSANLNLEGIPPGIYYVWLINSEGNIVATKKFTKQ